MTKINNIKQYNNSQIEARKDLPNLIGMIEQAQDGNIEVFDMYFYGHKEIDRVFYGGKSNGYEVNRVRFWDEPLSIFLTHLKRRYSKDITIGSHGDFGERRVSYQTNVSNFEESEIDALWYEWMLGFIYSVKLDNFKQESETKRLNAIRKYIRKSFENHLKKVDNERIALNRVRVDGELYYVKSNEEEVFFDDIYIGSDEEGNRLDFLDIVEHEDVYNLNLSESEQGNQSKRFVSSNLEDVLTNNQYEKYMMILEHIKIHGIESILDKHTNKIVKARVQRVAYPEKEYKNIERIDSLIKIMNKRMDKALGEEGIEYSIPENGATKSEKKKRRSSNVVTYTGGLTQEEVDRYFDNHLKNIYDLFIYGNLSFVKGENGMLPSIDTLLEIPFDVYDKFVSGGKKVKMNIIREYHNKEKFNLVSGDKEIIDERIEVKPEDKNNKYINTSQLRDIRRDSKWNK